MNDKLDYKKIIKKFATRKIRRTVFHKYKFLVILNFVIFKILILFYLLGPHFKIMLEATKMFGTALNGAIETLKGWKKEHRFLFTLHRTEIFLTCCLCEG